MKTKVRRNIGRAANGHYDDIVAKAVKSRSNHYRMLNTFGNPNSANAIRWMVENGRGIRAFEAYVPGTFQAIIRNDVEVWFRLA